MSTRNSTSRTFCSRNTAPAAWGSDQEVRALLAARAKTLHPGTANDCWFTDPSKALCLQLSGTPAARPADYNLSSDK